MEEKIKNYLNKIQEDKDIEILLACETGRENNAVTLSFSKT